MPIYVQTIEEYFAQRLNPIISKLIIPLNPPSTDFPSDVLKYMKANANSNPKSSVKLMKINKFFLQEKCPFTFLGQRITLFQDCLRDRNYKRFQMDELPNNLGFSDEFCVKDGRLLPQLMSKTVACELENLILKAQQISLDGFKFLISSGKVKRLELHSSSVINENDEIVPYEDLIDLIPSLRTLELNYNPTRKFSQKFTEKICDSNLKVLNINELTEDFDFEEFLNSLKIHAYIDKLLAAGLTDIYPPSVFGFHPEMDWNRRNALEGLRMQYNLRHYEIIL